MNGLLMASALYLFALQEHPHLSAISFARAVAAHKWLPTAQGCPRSNCIGASNACSLSGPCEPGSFARRFQGRSHGGPDNE